MQKGEPRLPFCALSASGWQLAARDSSYTGYTGGLPLIAPATNATSVNIRKMKKRIFAMPAAAPAMLVNPSTAAMIATMKNVSAHDNITNLLSRNSVEPVSSPSYQR